MSRAEKRRRAALVELRTALGNLAGASHADPTLTELVAELRQPIADAISELESNGRQRI